MRDGGNSRLLFGDFEFDTESRTLLRKGRPLKVQPQPLRVLGALLRRPGETVSREVLRADVWGESTFVEFDQGLNYCIRQIRLALHDGATNPTYIETLPKQGYRFIAEVRRVMDVAPDSTSSSQSSAAEPEVIEQAKLPGRPLDVPIPFRALPSRKWLLGLTAIAVALVLTSLLGSVYLTRFRHVSPPSTRYTQLTDFTDSAMAPTLSPDGRMVAFFRSDGSFLTSDQIYLKMLPNGAVKRLTDDGRFKYSVAFSPDGSQIAYTVIDSESFATYTVSVLGGESHLMLKNAAGLSWLNPDQLLFSEIKSGLHMGIVTATVARQHSREIYFPPYERGMAHYSYPSPDRKKALVIEMNERGDWANCRLISLDGAFPTKPAGPDGGCTSAAWSPDGSFMYFIAAVDGQSHLWRARYPGGQPEQITFGPTEEDGVAAEQNGQSVITSMGVHESTIWIHDSTNERALLSEGEILWQWSPPSFSADGKQLYYLLRHHSEASEPELWRTDLMSGVNEDLFPGLHMRSYAVSPDGQQVLYATGGGSSQTQLWIASIDKSSPARHIGQANDRSPHFGPHGEILFEFTEGKFNYLGRMKQDGSGRSKVVPYPISSVIGISPGQRWIMADIPIQPGESRAPVAIPTGGGPPRRICLSSCVPSWSLDGRALFVPVESPSRTSPGRSLIIPVGPGEDLSALPPEGIKPMAKVSDVPGSRSIDRAYFVPGADLSHFAYVKTAAHYNLFRVQLP